MMHLIDLFTPQELLHIVAVANKMEILTTSEKKYLLAVRMGTKYENGSYSLSDREKEKFLKIFFQFMQQYPSFYHCEKDPCAVCDRLRELKKDFQNDRNSDEFKLLMKWVTRSQAHYEGDQEEPESPASSEVSAAPLTAVSSEDFPLKEEVAAVSSSSEEAVQEEEVPGDPAPVVKPAAPVRPIRREPIRTDLGAVKEPVRPAVSSVKTAGDSEDYQDRNSEAVRSPEPSAESQDHRETKRFEAGAPVFHSVPLWTLNPDHPLGEALLRLGSVNPDFLDEDQVRDFAGEAGALLKNLSEVLLPGTKSVAKTRSSQARYA